MKITDLELIPVFSTREMGKTSPSDSEKEVSNHIIVLLYTNTDVMGLGEMSDVNFNPTKNHINFLKSRLKVKLTGQDPFKLTELQESLAQETWDHQVICGIDIALHDIIGKTLNIPVYQLFGGKYRDRIVFSYPLRPCSKKEDVVANLARVEKLLDKGHSTIRYYFGNNLDMDEQFLTKLRLRWNDDVEINALDASGKFDVADAIVAINRLAPFKPNLVESPVIGRHNAPISDFLAVKDAVPVLIGEHITDSAVAARMARYDAVDVFNIGVGYEGMTACRRLFGVAETFGIKALMGSTVELSIGTAARAHVAAAVPNMDFPCYPAGPLVYQEKIVKNPVRYEEGHLVIPEGPGIGVELDFDLLKSQKLW